MKLVSFYCDVDGGDYFSKCAKRLKDRCDFLEVDCLILEENFGQNWIDNVKAKPLFLLKIMNSINTDFIWLDVDCFLLKKPDFVNCHDWMVDFRKDNSPCDYVHFIKNTEQNKEFMYKWVDLINTKDLGSHTSFISLSCELNLGRIPDGYFKLGVSKINKKNEK
jgi:hypothetical protein